ncbi:uncharacterized protein LOC116203568 [Punica granatum]|uniref:Uncharacterized protein n=2 Tax=Punica granatum TaxID=22663 RepID=A0A2I0KT73_PUNGR|nr:uncharacterized protein LOC116203568 [Punica granatum]PKI71661.1 hypothetical protein CRG98_007984 [Punica granatum]
MATLASFLSSPLLLPTRHLYRKNHRHPHLLFHSSHFFSVSSPRICPAPRTIRSPIVRSSSAGAPFDELNWSEDSLPDISSKKSVLSALVQEIEPLDVSLIQKDVPLTTIDAMKRTISGMLGLLPSDQFQVYIEALWEPLSKLLISSMMTGYTLRNAEYRLCLEKNLDMHEENPEHPIAEGSELDVPEILLDSAKKIDFTGKNELPSKFEKIPEDTGGEIDIKGLGDIPHEAQQYILHLQSRLSSAKKELHEVKRKNAALQMQQFVGEEKNDLLDYLRSLQPEKVAELSEPTSPELKETIRSVVHGLLATLSPRMHSQPPPSSENTSVGKASAVNEDCAELVENTSLHFQPLISLTRDYLARLLFWCMLLGHYLRGLEYRLELVELLSLTAEAETDVPGSERVT